MNGIKKRSFSSLNIGFLLVVLACTVFYSFGMHKPVLLTSIDNKIMDIMFKIRGAQPVSGDIVIVDIDEKSLTKLGQWPWPRNLLAELTLKLFAGGARSVGFDIIFAEEDRMSPAHYFQTLEDSIRNKIPEPVLAKLQENDSFDYDTLLGNAVSMGPSVLGYAFLFKNDGLKSEDSVPFPSGTIRVEPSIDFKNISVIPAYRAVVNVPAVAQAESEGFLNVFPDSSGTTRQVPLLMMMDHIPYPSLAVETYRVGSGISALTIHASTDGNFSYASIIGISVGEKFIPTDSLGQIFVNYRGSGGTFKYISAVDVLQKQNQTDFKDKFVLIGSSSTGLFDLKTTPFSNAFPGVEINATIIDNLIKGDPFSYDVFSEIGLTYTLIIIGGLLLSAILSFSGPLAGGLGALIFFILSFMGNYYYFFLNNRHVGITYPLLTCTFILIFISIFNYFREGKDKRYIQKAFSHYLAPDVISQLLKNPESLSLKGKQQDLTVLFSDIRGFTSISEKMDSRELGDFMNNYLTRMSKIILDNGGTVDKFIGDAVMAFWGAPKDDPDHAFQAVKTALLMKKELKEIQNEFKKKNMPLISIGIGINSGIMSVGNFGSDIRFDYTVMGDNVNIASRLEGANKNYGTTILISKATLEKTNRRFFCCYIDKVQVKGRKEAIDLYEPLCEGLPEPKLSEEIHRFEEGLREYRKQHFQTARRIIEELHENNPCLLYSTYLERIRTFIQSPPPPDETGTEKHYRFPVHTLETK